MDRNPFEIAVSYGEKEMKLKFFSFKKLKSYLLKRVGLRFETGHLHKGLLHFPLHVFEPQNSQ